MNTQRLVIGLFTVVLGLGVICLPWALHQLRGRAEEVTLAMSAMVTIAFGLGVVAQAIQHRLPH